MQRDGMDSRASPRAQALLDTIRGLHSVTLPPSPLASILDELQWMPQDLYTWFPALARQFVWLGGGVLLAARVLAPGIS